MKLTAPEKALLREFDTIAQENPDKHSPEAKDWFDKVKASFGEREVFAMRGPYNDAMTRPSSWFALGVMMKDGRGYRNTLPRR